MILIVEKLKRSTILVRDPEARELFNDVMEKALVDYKMLSHQQFLNTPGLLNTFVEEFLNTYAYIGSPDGIRLPSYDPITIGYTEATTVKSSTHPPMPLEQWIAIWTNAFIIYSEYPEAPEHNHFLMGIAKDTYNEMIKVGNLSARR